MAGHDESKWQDLPPSGRMAGVQHTKLTVEFTAEELTLLTTLAADQLFRREFIDPKMPGHKPDPAELQVGKSLVARLRAAAGKVDLSSRSSPGAVGGRGAGTSSKRSAGVSDSV